MSKLDDPKPSNQPALLIDNNGCLIDGSLRISVCNLEPYERVRISASLKDAASVKWESSATFESDALGQIDLTKDAPVAEERFNSYNRVDPMGLIWAMKPKDGSERMCWTVPHPSSLKGEVIVWRLHNGSTARRDITLHVGGQGAVCQRIDDLGVPLVGDYFPSKSDGNTPGVLVLGGSSGEMRTDAASLLAARGFSALALKYFQGYDLGERFKNLPPYPMNIDLQYFKDAIDFIRNQEGVDPNKIVVWGSSRGGELALQLGALFPEVAGVVAYVPSDVRTFSGVQSNVAAWNYQGVDLPFTEKRIEELTEQEYRQVAIPLDRISGPVLMVSGTDDGLWESSYACERAKKNFPHVHHLKCEDAGHMIGIPNIPSTFRHYGGDPSKRPLGGSQEADQRAACLAWDKTIELIDSL